MTRLTDLKKAGGNSGLYLQKWMYSATMLTPRSSRLHSSVNISVICCSFLLSSLQYALDNEVIAKQKRIFFYAVFYKKMSKLPQNRIQAACQENVLGLPDASKHVFD